MSKSSYIADVGIHLIPVEAYYADPCPAPSLTRSGIIELMEHRPAHLRASHPRLTEWPEHAKKTTKQMDLGTVVHKLVLGAGQDFEVCNVPNWVVSGAKELKREAIALGKIPITQPMYRQALKVSETLSARLVDHFGTWPIGSSEVTMVRKIETPHGPIYARALADVLAVDLALCLDISTTECGLSDDEIDRKLVNDGKDVQGGWYLDFLAALYDLEGREKFLNVFAEVNPPYDVRFVEYPESWRTRVSFPIERAVNEFARCLYANDWPGYSRETYSPKMPPWHEAKLLNAELEA